VTACAGSGCRRGNVRDGSIAIEMGCLRYVRFPPVSARRTDIAECLKRANNGLMYTAVNSRTARLIPVHI
jgi:hypothetical protein